VRQVRGCLHRDISPVCRFPPDVALLLESRKEWGVQLADIDSLALFARLKKREVTDGFSPGEISSGVRSILVESAQLLNQVCRFFPQYTLHDAGHGHRVVENMAKILPPETLDNLNSIELSILIYSGYLHDIGMASTQAQLIAWVGSSQFSAFISSRTHWIDALRAADNAGNTSARRAIEDMAYTDYLRLTHAERGAQHVTQAHGPGSSGHQIEVKQVNYAHLVALLIESHWDDPQHLGSPAYHRDELVRDFPVNIQYIATILRISDVIDLDPERTPKVLLDFIDPLDPTSADEWAKHRSLQGWQVSSKRIRFQARCTHPAIQRGLVEWMEYIEHERFACASVLAASPESTQEKYQFSLHEPITSDRIESDGSYIYGDFRFHLDYERITDLLMGTQLWKDSDLAIRELLQNSTDTCQHRDALSRHAGLQYAPSIRTSFSVDHNGGKVLTCSDNGMGMNEHLIGQYFMRIGRSFYQSPEFREQSLTFTPISQFGLGVMSYFMLGDRISVETRALNADLSTLGPPLVIDIDGPHRYFVIRKGTRVDPGTDIRISLRADVQPAYFTWERWKLPARVVRLLRDPICPVEVIDEPESAKIGPSEWHVPTLTRLWGGHRLERPELLATHVA
jgi:molecular chaperone HtpG